MAPAIKAKVHSLPGVEHLYSAITKDQLEIPAYITEYDMTVSWTRSWFSVLFGQLEDARAHEIGSYKIRKQITIHCERDN